MSPLASWPPAARAAALAAAAALLLAAWASVAALLTMAGLGQLTASTDLAVLPGWLWYYRFDPEVARWMRIGGVGSGLLVVALVGAALLRIRRPLHGAARWAREGELKRGGLRAKTGLVLGRKNGRYLVFGGSEHVMLYAPTRTGKGVGVVIPNLLAWPDSVVVLDIKRENYQATAGYRADRGQTVHLFDPFAPDGWTARYNPLGLIDRSEPVRLLDELQKIAGMLFTVPERTDPFWAESARTGFVGVAAYVAQTPELPFTLGEVYRQLTLGDARARFPELIQSRARANRPLSAGCVNALADFCSASENTFAGIRQTMTSRMNLWLNPLVDAATCASDFDLSRLRDGRTSIYLTATPDNMARVAPLYNLLFQQLVDLNTRALPDPRNPGRQVLLLLDEFARLGHAGVVARGFAFVAGYGLRILAVIQSPSQLKAEYGPDVADEIMTNCGAEVVFAPKELRIANELSERLGYYTTLGRSRSRPALLGGRSGGSMSESEQRRALMLPQELIQMSPDDLMVLRAGLPPVRGRKLRYFAERELSTRVLPAPWPKTPPAPSSPPRRRATYAETPPVVEEQLGRLDPIHANSTEAVVLEREMSIEEAAGEALVTPEMISLALEDADMDGLPQQQATPEEVKAWAERYLDRVMFAAVEAELNEEEAAARTRLPPDPDRQAT